MQHGGLTVKLRAKMRRFFDNAQRSGGKQVVKVAPATHTRRRKTNPEE
jgi:hypothetical protein